MTNVIASAYNIYKERSNKVKDGKEAKAKEDEWKNFAKEIFKGKDDKETKAREDEWKNFAVKGKKAN